MATTYVGFFRPTDAALEVIGTAAPPREFLDKVNGFLNSFPDGLTHVGTYPIQGGDRRSVIIVEAEDYSGLQHIDSYYNGWLQFEWHPTTSSVARDQ
jgi:hypothetical protein